VECFRAVLIHARSYTQKTLFEALVTPFSIQKPSQKTQKHKNLVSNTEFEGGDDGNGHGEGTFLVK
jgi:hypothetical protein